MTSRRPRLIATLAASVLVVAVAPALAATLSTTITSGPQGLIASRTATFRFKSNVADATFQCKLDAGAWSACASPRKYSELSQGQHTFRVRAREGASVDPTPAARTFKVDTVKPQTTILTGPSGVTDELTPSFTFSSSEAGTFQCRLLSSSSFTTCSSPFVPASPLNDGDYNFQVRARDKAGNVDSTPASRSFTVERLLVPGVEAARAVAELYFPDDLVMDVPPNCVTSSNETKIDCPAGTPLAPSDQLSITSDRTVDEVSPNNYDVTITSDVSTLRSVAVSWLSVDCAVALTSAYEDVPTWTVTMDLTFDTDPGSGEPRVTYSNLDVSGVEPTDWGIQSWGEVQQVCGQGHFDSAFVADAYAYMLTTYLDQMGNPLCAVTGPEYLGECP